MIIAIHFLIPLGSIFCVLITLQVDGAKIQFFSNISIFFRCIWKCFTRNTRATGSISVHCGPTQQPRLLQTHRNYPSNTLLGFCIRTISRPGADGCLQASGHGRNQEGPGETTPRLETNQRQHTTASPHGGARAGGTTASPHGGACAGGTASPPRGAHAQGGTASPPRQRQGGAGAGGYTTYQTDTTNSLRGGPRTPRAGAGGTPKAARTAGRRRYFSARAGTAGARCPRRPDTPGQ